MPGGMIGSEALRDLVARGQSRRFQYPIADLDRLASVAVAGPGEPGHLSATLVFAAGGEGRPQLALEVKGTIRLTCQRCLEPLMWPLEVRAVLTMVGSEAEAMQLEDPFDVVLVPEEGLSPALVIEDEVLAGLPLSPLHDAADPACKVPGGDAGIVVAAADRPQEVNTPLAGLAALMGRDRHEAND